MDIQFIRRLAELLEKSAIDEIEVVEGDNKVRITRHVAPAHTAPTVTYTQPMAVAAAMPTVAPVASTPPAAVEQPPQGYVIKSPMVGTFYRAASPEAAPFVEEGSLIKAGQTLCIIEAMKLLNEIEADISGKVIKVLASNSQPVEYGEPLFIIAPENGDV
ncbi:acetyl-CoA carboxylase biotin carboxyl carrier protein [Acidithiobacillus ferrivorans]|uniref:Biotin carboxyl carrier protein of acetyl-CoA carboxylase n=1 Tax=Acidithiobacillus ferrivorans TaxID=160808 RepID=A0A1B9BVK3_9PROT|nr:acetyl-CoA carboxylase biotin carboxyl carrier protein [Acidithiobacillus ferrivorans]MBN6741349.1 acetyl-CoA carboxylase biotin carboxyl carrier protein [Acidithiobacillus sp. MC6.1]OCB01737.1 acetyl-CoA carboxylase, biotin carboxyl carrier protein [Acidithiobacillus ferrivorans]QQD72500.1 acetyl-CoA carboxylase biotin carboxyl carrier protein [Acidithiobacillus ferrivorans]